MKLLLAGLLVVAIGACGGGGGDDDGTMPDAANPHMLEPCMMGSATLCEDACLAPGSGEAMPCGAQDESRDMTYCEMTFEDSDGKRGCCVDVSGPNTGGAHIVRFLECI